MMLSQPTQGKQLRGVEVYVVGRTRVLYHYGSTWCSTDSLTWSIRRDRLGDLYGIVEIMECVTDPSSNQLTR
jgi:hypothetical protein